MSHHQDPLDAVVTLTEGIVPTAGGASITVVTEAGASTRVSSAAWDVGLDRVQYGVGTGPCVDAAIGGEVCEISDMATDPRWPPFVSAARLAGTGSWMSVPVPVDDGLVASLNVSARTSGAFTPNDRAALLKLATVAAAALSTSPEPGVHPPFAPRAVVDQAKGILMHGGLSPTDALDSLGRRAHDAGEGLQAAAQRLVDETSGT
jgi:hypothetical protein